MATKHNSPCLLKAADDEPIFVLRAQDASAPLTIRMWADWNKNTLKPEKYQAALDLACEMEQWHNRKQPD
jgi:hypothetical protein